MASLAETPISATGSATNAASYNTASVTPAADRTLILFVGSRRNTAAEPAIPTITGNGLDWSFVRQNWHSTDRKLTCWIATTGPSGGSTGAITIAFGGQTQLNCQWYLAAFSGTYRAPVIAQATTALGAGACRTIAAIGGSNQSSQTSWSTTANGIPYQSGDINIACFHESGTVAPTVFERNNQGYANIESHLFGVQLYEGDDDSITWTFGSACNGAVQQIRLLDAANYKEPSSNLVVPSLAAVNRASRW